MEIKLVENVKEIPCDVLIISKFKDKETTSDLANKFLPEDFECKKGEIFVIHTHGEQNAKYILVVGLGDEKDLTNNVIRESVSKAIKKCACLKAKKVAVEFNTDYNYGGPALLGASIANYHFDKYKTKKDHRINEFYLPSDVDVELVERAEVVSEAMRFSRNLSNEPAAFATPTKLAEIAQGLEGIETEVFNSAKIQELGMGAYLAVAKGSVEPPKFIHMKYTPKHAKKKIAIIGKGLCFDSGGLDIKPPSSMLTMRDDMSAAASVIAIMRAMAKLKPDVEVHGIVAACENMPGAGAYKPGDILTAMNGKTIEVDNTDAEGRLTLADALCFACKLKVDEVVDIATLTGACMVALGTAATGIMGNDEKFIHDIIETGKIAGEKYWELPMWQEYRDQMDSEIADMKNTGTRYGGASAAGMFLKEFVTDDVKWAHLDVAGTAFIEKPQKEFLCGGSTAAGVRTMIKYIIEQ